MKNLHILPTKEPSRLYEFGGEIILTNEPTSAFRNQNIYITSDEEIKEEDWFLLDMSHSSHPNEVHQMGNNKKSKTGGINFKEVNSWTKSCKKIILTTDPDLIQDGVQKIDDEFLVWFVKNPSCEFADVNDWMSTNGSISFGGDTRYQLCNHLHSKSIIPKQETTLEETAGNLADPNICKTGNWIAGAKWEAERSYNEKEVLDLLRKSHFIEQNIDEWFEQNKKK